ncbi:kinetochore protein Nuf2, partial [Enteropsectra breve]
DLFVGPSKPVSDESLQVIRQVQRMGEFLQRLGVTNFTIRDINPDSKRLVQILSTIINFGMYRDNQRHVYERASHVAEDNYRAKAELERRMASLSEEIRTLQEKLAENSSEAKSLQEEVEMLQTELKNFYRHQKDKISEVTLLKHEKAEFEDRLCSLQLVEHNLRQEIACLKTQVVSDPTKLMELVEEMRELIEKEKTAIKNIERNSGHKQAQQQRINILKEQVHKAIEIRDEIAAVDEKTERMGQENIMLEGRLKNWDSNISALKIRISHIERQISHIESKILNLQTKDKKCSEEISDKIKNLKLKYDNVSGERGDMMERVKENNMKIQELAYERVKQSGEYDKECSELINMLIKLNNQIKSQCSEIKSIIGE